VYRLSAITVVKPFTETHSGLRRLLNCEVIHAVQMHSEAKCTIALKTSGKTLVHDYVESFALWWLTLSRQITGLGRTLLDAHSAANLPALTCTNGVSELLLAMVLIMYIRDINNFISGRQLLEGWNFHKSRCLRHLLGMSPFVYIHLDFPVSHIWAQMLHLKKFLILVLRDVLRITIYWRRWK